MTVVLLVFSFPFSQTHSGDRCADFTCAFSSGERSIGSKLEGTLLDLLMMHIGHRVFSTPLTRSSTPPCSSWRIDSMVGLWSVNAHRYRVVPDSELDLFDSPDHIRWLRGKS